ncbi:hypothetical protein PybrP1_002129 [[Pythium] brassicae (nom. inval.)]|nr:hypothetical protein PybrP1_002129 [[Pythium] brassicae (nom. inval.)]
MPVLGAGSRQRRELGTTLRTSHYTNTRHAHAHYPIALMMNSDSVVPRSLVASMQHVSMRMRTGDQPLVLELRSFQYRCAWLFIVTLHAICAVYLTLLGDAYRFITQPYILYYGQQAAGDRAVLLTCSGVATTAVGVFHWWQLLCTIWAAIRAKKLEFASGSSAVIGAVSAVCGKLSDCTAKPAKPQSLSLIQTTNRQRWYATVWALLFTRRGVFRVESPVFHFVSTAREIIETVQAQRSGALLARPWLNHVVILNCWSTPILQHAFHHHSAGRVVSLPLDALLNMGMSMAIPLAVFLPYYRSFSFATLAFPSQNYYDTVWFSQLVMELQFLFSISDANFVSKFVTPCGIYASLIRVTTLIQRKRSGDCGVDPGSQNSVTPAPTFEQVDSCKHKSTEVAPASPAVDQLSGYKPESIKMPASWAVSLMKRVLMRLLFTTYVFTLLTIHRHPSARLQK